MKKITLIALLLTIMSYAQDQGGSKIKVYTPSSSPSSSNSSNTYKWAVKTDLFAFISGEFPVIAEYRITNKLSIEGSAGLTYSFIENNIFNKDKYGSDFESKASSGTAFRAGIKFYPSSDYDAIEGWSFGIQVFNKVNNRVYENDTYSSYNLDGLKDTKTKTGIELTIAKQLFQDSNITFESIMGIGFANIKYDYYTTEYNGTTTELTHKSFSEGAPNFHLGCRIGFGN